MSLRLLGSVVLLALLAACVGPPEDVDAVPRFERDTFPGEIQERGVLRVGVPTQPEKPMLLEDPATGELSGFIVDLTEELAAALDVDVEFIAASEEELLDPGDARAEPGSEDEPGFDIGFPITTISEPVAREAAFTNPYFVAHQLLLAPSDPEVDGPGDLGGEVVCSVVDEDIGVDLRDIEPSIEIIEGSRAECERLVRSGRAGFATGRNTTLMDIWSGLDRCLPECGDAPLGFTLAGDDLTTEGIGASLPGGTSGWGTFVNATWGEMELEGRWTESYERWLRPYLDEPLDPPEMTFREAAGLFPAGI